MAAIEGGKETEAYLHEMFSADNIGGEWFTLSENLSSFIRDIQNGKKGMIPFVDEAKYMSRSTADYSDDAIELARQMAVAVLNNEFRGIGDTIDAAMHRIELKHGLKRTVLKRLRYRGEKRDIWAGEYLHIKSLYEQLVLSKPASREVAAMSVAAVEA